MSRSDGRLATVLAIAAAAVFVALSVGHPTPFDYFGRLAAAFWRGEWWLDDAPPHLNELIAGAGGHRYSLVPPFPALLLVPLVPFFPTAVAQTTISAAVGGLSAGPLYLAQRALAVPRGLALWTALLSTFGTTLFVSAIDGRSWFAADAIAFACCAVALLFAARRAPPVLTGVALGAAVLTRAPLILCAPALLALQLRGEPRRTAGRTVLWLGAGLLPFVAAYLAYDVMRWGTPFDVGYGTFAATDPFYSRGLFSVTYLPRQLYAIFFESPAFSDGDVMFLRARSVGLSVLFATPALLWIARGAVVGTPLARALVLGCLALVPDLFFGTVGFEQYGYRRSLDAQAFLIPLVAVGGGWVEGRWLPSGTLLLRGAIVASIVITAYFFVTIRMYGFA
jgi:hypothetical protein